jgi:hypothetical protein
MWDLAKRYVWSGEDLYTYTMANATLMPESLDEPKE